MEAYASFKRHVNDIHNAAAIVIEKKLLKKLVWPELRESDAGEEGFKLEFPEPVVIWNAPMRGSSSSSARRVIVMDGCFYFKENTFGKGNASLEVYGISRPNDGWRLELLEAMHFDIEANALHQSPFHPMFHVQFGKNHRWDIADLQQRVAKLAKTDVDKVDIDRSMQMHTRDVRIPTPQMDYLSMLVMVVADFFCEKNSTHEVKAGFKRLIEKVAHSRNTARVGQQGRELEGRWTIPNSDKQFGAVHWYQESCR
ncbi:hypothetical protein [Pseudomonas gingeri]|uniref:Uncharacterized protein n=1 Tax=Pseudomonas gingeri TaxID=117681 RepID=A0A7Y8BIE2_9PSED|nr:hypothetical protein [Pseudomonas gingeri]NWB44864.1 hypothetical protein [Pseudomonas gingeri]